MLIDCPACERSYHVSRAELDGGRTVICPRCDARWFAGGDGALATLEPSLDDLRAEGVSRRAASVDSPELPGLVTRSLLRRIPSAFMAATAGLVVLMALIGARERVVRLVPRAAALYAAVKMPVNVRGLEFADVRPVRRDPASPEVTISGEIRNVVQRRVRVPRVAYEVRDAAGEPLMAWTEKAPANVVGAGRVLAFTSAPHQMPPESRAVVVRFDTDEAPAPLRIASHFENRRG